MKNKMKSVTKGLVVSLALLSANDTLAAGLVNFSASALDTLDKGMEFKEALEKANHYTKVAEMVSGIYINKTVFKLYDQVVGRDQSQSPEIIQSKQKKFYSLARTDAVGLPDNIYLSNYGENDYLIVMANLTHESCEGFAKALNNDSIQRLIVNPGDKKNVCKFFGGNVVAYVPKTFNPNYD